MPNHKYRRIVQLKAADLCLQLLCFLLIPASFIVDGAAWIGVSILIMAGIQVFSAICWLMILFSEREQTIGGKLIRIVFVVVPVLLLALSNTPVILYLLYLMIFAGPVLGFLYFFITLFEITFYHKLARSTQ